MLSVKQLCVTVDQTPLLSDINFALTTPDYLCILGQNGAGKSTLLKTLMGIIPPLSGDISLNGQSFRSLSQRELARQISYVAQHHSATQFSVSDFIKLARYPYQSAFSQWQKSDQQAYDSAVTLTAIEPFLPRLLATLSGGERQRVMIAAALCQQAPLLLLDEPSHFLDPQQRVVIHRLIKQLYQQHGLSIIEVTHDINHALDVSQHILALKNGRSVWCGETSDLLGNNLLPNIYEQAFVTTKHPETGQTIVLTSDNRTL